jgi:pimeloyl-ACP methyl ester carboxylesterase
MDLATLSRRGISPLVIVTALDWKEDLNARKKVTMGRHMKHIREVVFTIAAAVLLVVAGCKTTEPSAAAKSHFTTFGTNKIHYVTQGKGRQTVVLIHCWSGNVGFWREQVPALAGKARLILIDLPGHGQSDKPHTAYTMDFFAGAVLAVMNDAGVKKATLIGHSMGTPIMCRVYKQAPDRVAALVAVDGTLRRPEMAPGQAEVMIAEIKKPNYREGLRQFMGTMFPVAGTEALRDRVIAEMLHTPQHVMVSSMEGMFSPHQPDWHLPQVNIPVLVINAPNPMWTDKYIEYVRSLSPQVDYRAIDGVGHWLMLEKPAEFNANLTEMLGKFDLIGR